MNFELSTSNRVNDFDKYDEDFVKQPVNLLKWLTEYLDSLNINILDVVCIRDRITGEEVSFISSKPELDKLYYRNEYPSYVETDSSDFKYVEYPIVNPDLIFRLNQGDFIDFQGFNHSTYDGGFIFWDFRFNDMRYHHEHDGTQSPPVRIAEAMSTYRQIREKQGVKTDFSLEKELEDQTSKSSSNDGSVFPTRPVLKTPVVNIALPNIYQLFLFYCQPHTAADIKSIEQIEWVDGVDWVDEFSHRLIEYSLDEYKTVADKPIFSIDLINYKRKEGLDPFCKVYVNFKDGSRGAFEVMWDNRTYDYLFGTWSSIPK